MLFLSAEVTNGDQLRIKSVVTIGHHAMFKKSIYLLFYIVLIILFK